MPCKWGWEHARKALSNSGARVTFVAPPGSQQCYHQREACTAAHSNAVLAQGSCCCPGARIALWSAAKLPLHEDRAVACSSGALARGS